MRRQLPGSTHSMRSRRRPANSEDGEEEETSSGGAGAPAAGDEDEDEHAGRRRSDVRHARTITHVDRAIAACAAIVALVVLGTASQLGRSGSWRLVDGDDGMSLRPGHGMVGGDALLAVKGDGGIVMTTPQRAEGRRNLDVGGTLGTSASNEPTSFHGVDVFVAGFAKCGTTTMKRFFELHSDEYAFLGSETVVNSILYGTGNGHNRWSSYVNPEWTIQRLEERFNEVTMKGEKGGGKKGGSVEMLKTAIKTPRGILDSSALRILAGATTAETRIVIGVRHPVRWFESYYNFRVSKLVALNRTDNILPAETLIGSGKRMPGWREICTDNARFDLFLSQLGKHVGPMSPAELKEMQHYKLRVAPNHYKVFLYHLEQLPAPPSSGSDRTDDDSGDTRRRGQAANRKFDEDFRNFVRLDGEVGPWSWENKGRRSDDADGGDERNNVEIDICDGRYGELRRTLVENGRVAAGWIRDRFLPSDDVVVSSEDLFLELLSSWELDPCGGNNDGREASRDVPLGTE